MLFFGLLGGGFVVVFWLLCSEDFVVVYEW